MLIKFLVIACIVLTFVFVFTQIIGPMFFNTPLFPFFRSLPKEKSLSDLQRDLEIAKEAVIKAQLQKQVEETHEAAQKVSKPKFPDGKTDVAPLG